MTIFTIIARFADNRNLAKKLPTILPDLESISKSAKEQVIQGIMQIYKFQHTI
jgi:hypothetical protein